jgi:hypothetical protein
VATNQVHDPAKRFAVSELHMMLSSHGFKRKGLTWNRRRGKFTDVVNQQIEKGVERGTGMFTLNLGVCHTDLYKLFWQKEQPPFIQETDCPVRLRAGALLDDGLWRDRGRSANMKSRRDQWWSYSATTDWVGLAHQIQGQVDALIMPFFSSIDSLESIREFLAVLYGLKIAMPIDQMYLAIVEFTTGQHELARQLIADVSSVSTALRTKADRIYSALLVHV